jgi:PTS system mannitol-specific IIC component
VLIQTANDSYLGVILSVVLSATVSFLVAAVILRASRTRDLAALADGKDAFGSAVDKNADNKGGSSRVGDLLGQGGTATSTKISNVVFACDAGMGSSAMGATVLRKKLKEAGVTGVTVTNKAIANLDAAADLVITHQDLTDRARHAAPDAEHVSVENFMNSPKYDEVVQHIKGQQS